MTSSSFEYFVKYGVLAVTSNILFE